ncbi:A1pp-domain-containing protein [Piedraia hortae CBS 480.64]|uniref:A1pp-domain-containing protein n=1 Tax=Piedraia hortae CBS 480.64 TaxID=1314780 RepID=A0A6A7BZ42_9PEZI|nr:A1pp-domain-containing protein [Piedraia hortae CBS 480.64]
MPSTIPLSSLPTLTQLYKAKTLAPTSSGNLLRGATSAFNDKISLYRGDITALETDAIVNAANEKLLGGGGVDGAIHAAAGPELVEECRALNGCNTGDAKITDAYKLPCKKVIHTVGPVYHYESNPAKLLSSCYTKSLDLADQNGCKSIAFSAISTGVYGYPGTDAAEKATEAVRNWLERDEERAAHMEKIVFCLFREKDERCYHQIIPKIFPPKEEHGDDS